MGPVRSLACVTALLAGAAVAATALLNASGAAHHLPQALPVWVGALLGLVIGIPVSIGLRIIWAQPANRVGWILLAGPLLQVLPLLAFTYAGYGVLVNKAVPGVSWSVLFAAASWPLLFAWPVAVALVFPAGSTLSSRWRRFAIAATANAVVFMSLGALTTSFDAPFQGVSNPIVGRGPVPGERIFSVIWVVPWLAMLATIAGAGLAIYLRVRRSSGIERLQALWLAWAVSLLPLTMIPILVGGYVLPVLQNLDLVVLFGVEIAVAVAVGVAVLRYRLYEIERIVNRTLVYAVLTTLLAATFGLLALALGVVLGRGSAWTTGGATLATAATFGPLRRRLQGVVDRRFSRLRHLSLRLVREFEVAVRSGAAEPEDIEATLRAALRDPDARLFYRLGGTDGYVDGDGTPVAGDPLAAATPITRQGQEIGLLVPGRDIQLEQAPDLRRAIVEAAALTIEIARLRIDLRLSLAEVDHSRRRIVQATNDERRRLERDLHDGAQQRLVSLGVHLRRLQRSLPSEARVLAPALGDAVDEVAHAIADLRTIAAGIRPPRLDDGLHVALAELVRNSPVPVHLDLPGERLPASIEETAFYVALEAITNAVKHASPSRVDVCGIRRDAHLHLSIADDGVGGARAGGGSGLTGLGDRVQAHGGQLRILSPAGHGTRVEVALPCES
jgi:signal transduction histidine kinase